MATTVQSPQIAEKVEIVVEKIENAVDNAIEKIEKTSEAIDSDVVKIEQAAAEELGIEELPKEEFSQSVAHREY